MLEAASLPINVRITPVWHDIRKSQNQLLGPMIDSTNAFTSPSYCSTMIRTTLARRSSTLGLVLLLKAFVEHFYQSLTRDGSLAVMGGDHPRFSIQWSTRKLRFASTTLRFYRHRLTPQQNPETLSLWPLRHPISLNCSGVRKRSTAARSSVR